MPTRRHQAIVGFLYRLLHMYMQQRGGAVFLAPLRLALGKDKFREPDLMLALDTEDPRLQDAYFLGVDLVIEVVSPDSIVRDTVTKRADYAQGRIPEYWIVNPIDETIIVLQLQEDQYIEYGVFRRGDAVASALLRGFTVEVNEVFDALEAVLGITATRVCSTPSLNPTFASATANPRAIKRLSTSICGLGSPLPARYSATSSFPPGSTNRSSRRST